MARPPIRTSGLGLCLLGSLVCAACTPGSPAASDRLATELPPRSAAASASAAPATSADVPSPRVSAAAGDDRLLQTIAMQGGPDMPTEAFGSLWVLTVDGPIMGDDVPPSVQRIDPATGEVIATVDLPGRLCQGIGASPDALWACGPDGVRRIDPNTNRVVAEVPFHAPLAVTRISFGAGSIWAFATATVGPDTVVRIDPATNSVVATISLGHVAGTMAFGFDALWVTSPADDVLLRVDPAANVVEEWSSGIEGAGQVAAGPDALWVTLYGEHGAQAPDGAATIVRIDAASGDVTAEIDAGTGLEDSSGIVATADAVWVRGTDPFLVRIDPQTAELVDEIDGDHGTGDVTVAFDSVWATSEHGRVMRFSLVP